MKKTLDELKRFRKGMSSYAIPTYSAAGAFYFFLSMVPITVLTSTLLPYTPVSQEMLTEALGALLPESMMELLEGVLQDLYSRSAAVFSISLLLTLWSAAKAVLALMRGMDEIHEVSASERQPSLLRRLLAAVYTLLLLFIVILAFVLMVLGGRILALMRQLLPDFAPPAFLEDVSRYVLTLAFLFIMFTLMLKWVPDKKLPLLKQWPGALFAAAGWVLFSLAFSAYLAYSGGYSTYGRLAGIVIAMMWMYWCVYIVLLGAYLNKYLMERKRGQPFTSSAPE